MIFGSAILIAALLLEPATQPTTVPTEAVQTLVTQLIGADVAARDAAQKALLGSADEVLPALKTARAESRDPDVQLRLDTLIVQVQERVDIGGSRLTLKFTDAPLNVVLDSIETQAHAAFGDLAQDFGTGNGSQLPKVTLDLQNVSFWEALREIQDQAKVVFLPQPDGWRVVKNFGQMSQVHGEESGAFLVSPTMASYSRSVMYARNMGGGGENFTLQFTMLAEPKIHLAGGTAALQIDRAVDSNGNDLLVSGGVRNQMVAGYGQGQNQIGCAIPLKYPKSAGETITEISGTIRLSMADVPKRSRAMT